MSGATLAEARALAHPLRLRIIRLCTDDALTNEQLAGRLGVNAGTALHHVRTLVSNGFLAEQEPRPGRRGTVEKPYRSTGKSWRLDIGTSPERSSIERAMLAAVAVEVDEAGPDSVLELTRVSLRLNASTTAALHSEIGALIERYANAEEPGGEPLGMLVVLHRRPSAPA
jgi:predicted ArsR family transcriptional regulator